MTEPAHTMRAPRLTPYTNGFRAGAQWAAYETYADNIEAAQCLKGSKDPLAELDHLPVERWHE